MQEKNNQLVKRLLQTVRGMLATTDSKHFTNRFLLRCEQHVMRHAAHLAEMLEGTLARSGHSVSFFHIQHLQASFYGSIGQGHSVRICGVSSFSKILSNFLNGALKKKKTENQNQQPPPHPQAPTAKKQKTKTKTTTKIKIKSVFLNIQNLLIINDSTVSVQYTRLPSFIAS